MDESHDINLRIKVGAQGVEKIDLTGDKLDRLQGRAGKAEKGMGRFGKTLGIIPPQIKLVIAAVTALLAVMTAGTVAFAQFDRQVGEVSTMLDERSMGLERYTETLGEYRDGLRELSVDMGEATSTLSKGLYDVLSASVEPAKAMEVLGVSAKAAKAGLTDTATSVDFITSALNAYGKSADEAGAVSDIAFATVASGKLTFSELAASIGEVAPTANMAGVSLEKLGAMMATTTKAGINANESATAINQFMLSFVQKGPKAAATWAELAEGTELAGRAWNSSLLKGNDLAKTLDVLRRANDEQLTGIFSNIRALKAANVLVRQADDYRANLARTTSSAGETERAYVKVSGDLTTQWKKLVQIGKDLATTIGEGVAPEVKAIVEGLTKWYKANGELLKTDILIWIEKLKRGLGGIKDLLTLGGFVSGGSVTADVEQLQDELAEAQKALSVAQGLRDKLQAALDGDEPSIVSTAHLERGIALQSNRVASRTAEVELLLRKLDIFYGKLAGIQDSWQTTNLRNSAAKAERLAEEQAAWLASDQISGAADGWQQRDSRYAEAAKADKAALAEVAKLRMTEHQAELARIDEQVSKAQAAGASQAALIQLRSARLEKENKAQADRAEQARQKELSGWQKNNAAILSMAEQRRKAFDLLHGNIQAGQQAAADNERKLTEQATRDQQTYHSMLADLTNDTNVKRLADYEQFAAQVEALNISQLEKENLLALKRGELNKSSFERVLDSWSDTTANMETLTEDSLKSIQGLFRSIFDDLFDDFKLSWSSVLDVLKRTASNFFSQFATSLSTDLFARGSKWLINAFSSSQPPAGFGGGLGGGLSNSLPSPTGLGNLFDFGPMTVTPQSTGAQFLMLERGIPYNAGMFGQGGVLGTGLTGAGMATSGIGGALTGWQISQMLYGSGTGAQIGGALGGGAGGIAGAAIGTAVMPGVGTVIGGALGGMLGGAGGGGIGSLFDGEDDEQAALQAFEDFKSRLAQVQTEGMNGWEDYAYLVEQYHTSDNRAQSVISSEDLQALAQAAGIWYAPDAYQVSGAGGEAGQGYWMSQALGGDLADMAGAHQGAEALTSFGDALDGIGEKMGPWSVALQDVLDGLDLTNLSSEELAATLEERLNPATVIQAQLTEDLAGGMDMLTAHKRALNTTIDALLGSVNLESQQQEELIDLLMTQSASVEDITNKYNRLTEITNLLSGAHSLSREEVKALVEEGRSLRGELGLQQTDFNDVKESITTLVDEISKLIEELNNIPEEINTNVNTYYNSYGQGQQQSHHTGGLVTMHSGGMVDQALKAGLITAHGGGQVNQLLPDEVLRVLQLGEFVIQRDAVTPATLPLLNWVNDGGAALLPVAMQAPERPQEGGSRPVLVIEHLDIEINVEGDMVGEAGALERVAEAAAEGVQAKLKEASESGEGVICADGVYARRWGNA